MPLPTYLTEFTVLISLEILHVIVLLLYLYRHRASAVLKTTGNIVKVYYAWKTPRGWGITKYKIEYMKNGKVCFGESLEFDIACGKRLWLEPRISL